MPQTRIAVDARGHINTQRRVLPLGIAFSNTDPTRPGRQASKIPRHLIVAVQIQRFCTLSIGHDGNPRGSEPVAPQQHEPS